MIQIANTAWSLSDGVFRHWFNKISMGCSRKVKYNFNGHILMVF